MQNETLQNFFQLSPLLMGIVDITDNDIIYVSTNRSTTRVLGVEGVMLEGKTARELKVSDQIINDWVSFYKEIEKKKTPQNVEYWIDTPYGKRCLSGTIFYMGVADKGLPRFSYILQDVTEARQIELELKRQEDFLNTILDNIPAMIFVKDAKDLRFLIFNKAGQELIGLTKDNFIGKTDFDLFTKEQAEFFSATDRKVFADRKLVDIPKEEIKTKDGVKYLHTKKIPLYNENNEPMYLVGISEDITEKLIGEDIKKQMYEEKEARQEVEKLLESRDEFISVASHELKSPLSSLILQAQMFKRNLAQGKVESPEKMKQIMEMTEKQVMKLDRLVNDMLDVSRIRTGKLKIDKIEFNLHDLISDVVNKMKNQFILVTGSPLEFTYTHEDVVGHWDVLRIEQVIVNLFTNALRYGNGRPVKVHLTKTDKLAKFTVQDQGIGIAPDMIDKVFDRFVRAVNASEVSGLGLGLFICKQIIKIHGGNIYVESTSGKGATFIVELPLY